MKAGTVRGADQREFVKAFNGICNWNNNWERWNDMVKLFAVSIANSVDRNNYEKREKEYNRIRGRYKPQEFEGFVTCFGLLIESLERNPFQDFLGQMYMELEMGSQAHGQCFTPFGVCQAMANMTIREDEVRKELDDHGWICINDCACGAGATLIAAAERLYQLGINYQQRALVIAGDIDQTVAMMCYIQLSLLGCAGRVRIADTLTDPETGPVLIGNGGKHTWYTPMFYSGIWSGRVFALKANQMFAGQLKKAASAAAEVKKEEKEDGERGGIQISFFD